MSPADHNKTLVTLYTLLGSFFSLGILLAPWLIAKNVDPYPSSRRTDQLIMMSVGFCVVLTLTLLFYATALGLSRLTPWGRTLAFASAGVLIWLCTPVAIYTWYVMHSTGGKQLYETGLTESAPSHGKSSA